MKMTSPSTTRQIIVNAVRTPPDLVKHQAGKVEVFFKIEPTPIDNERPEDRAPVEDLMHHLLNSLIKGLNS